MFALPATERSQVFAWLLVMPLVLTPPYWLSNHLTLFPARPVPRLPIDELIAFQPGFVWVYLALFPFMWVAVLAQRSARDAKQYVLGAAACAWGVSVLFVLFPTSFPRPAGSGWLYGLVTAMDTERNACPSLHGTYVAYSLAWLMRAWRSPAARTAAAIAAGAILFATIAIRQHGSLDLAAGIVIGLAAFHWAARNHAPAQEAQ